MVFYEVYGKIKSKAIKGGAATPDGAECKSAVESLFDKNGRVEKDKTLFVQNAVENVAVQLAVFKSRNVEARRAAERFGMNYIDGVELICNYDGEGGFDKNFICYILGYDFYLGDMVKFLSEHKKSDKILTIKEGIKAIHECGGVAVWARPYSRLSYKVQVANERLEAVAQKMDEYGLDGIEAFYQAYRPEEILFLESLAKKYNWLTTVGTDYHGGSFLEKINFEKEAVETEPTVVDYFKEREKHKRNEKELCDAIFNLVMQSIPKVISGKMIIAVDFDGTLCFEKPFPMIGMPRMRLIKLLKELKSNYDVKLILWTCRMKKCLQMAVDWCKEHGLYFDAVNENLQEVIEKERCDPRKIVADIYIDDRSINFTKKETE